MSKKRTIKIQGGSDKKRGGMVETRTIAGTFDIGDGIEHAYQITLTGEDIKSNPQAQEQVIKRKVKELIDNFQKASPQSLTEEKTNTWNQTYTENS